MNKTTKKIILYGVICISIVFIFISIFAHKHKADELKYIDKASAARSLVLLNNNTSGIKTYYGMQEADGWQEAYFENFYTFISSKKPDMPSGYEPKAFTYGEFIEFIKATGIENKQIEEYCGIKISKKNKKEKVKKTDFDKIFEYLVLVMGKEKGVDRRELDIVATANSLSAEQRYTFGEWSVVTNQGVFLYEGECLDEYIDTNIAVYTNGNRIVRFLTKVDEEVTYSNVWVNIEGGNKLNAYIYGVWRMIDLSSFVAENGDLIADLSFSNKKLSGMTLKKDMITGKVQRISAEQIEIEGYGSLNFEDNFKIYKNYGEFSFANINDIVVGYSLADFVVANGKVCAAVINRELEADNIRILIMNNGYETIFHERVTLGCEDGMIIEKGKNTVEVAPGELVDIYPDCELLDEGRIKITPKGINSSIRIYSVERSYGNPDYQGQLEIACEQGKILVVNELPLEKYLTYVVPSEMPVKFGVEALKVQAVCARSYAYKHILDNSYRIYGAHVDDSVNFQVYNNIRPQPASTQAVRETYGQVISKDGDIVSAYYYSTSCGHTSDISLWGENTPEYDMYTAKLVNPKGTHTNLNDEADFKAFISKKDESDFDYEFPYYRWNVYVPLEDVSARVNEYIKIRQNSEPHNILSGDGNGGFVEDNNPDVGRVKAIEIVKRSSGGAIKELVIRGELNDVFVRGELNIRYILGPGENPITTNAGTQTVFYILPSAYFYPEAVYEDDSLVGIKFIGGGYGHGIGMSQNAVSSMTKRGMRYDEIINFFYENTDIMYIY